MGALRIGLPMVSVLLVLSACSGGAKVDAYPRVAGTETLCDMLLADLPPEVAGQERQDIDQSVPAAAWGEDPIVLRCGVEPPKALTLDSRCDVVNEIGWFTEETADGRRFTTIGRTANVEVEVPADIEPAADALVDLSASIAKHVRETKPCV